MAEVATAAFAPPQDWTVADLLARVGGIPPEHVHLVPAPGTATEKDLLEAEARTGRICELIDGVLVEKTTGSYESAVAAAMIYFLKDHVRRRRLGIVLGEGGMLRLFPGQVRIPDVSFISFQRLAGQRLPEHPILAGAPDLAVEVLSESNTRAEMDRKLREYFASSCRLVWYIDPRTRTARSFTAPDQGQAIAEDGTLTGGEVLPEFTLALRDLWAEAEGEGST